MPLTYNSLRPQGQFCSHTSLKTVSYSMIIYIKHSSESTIFSYLLLPLHFSFPVTILLCHLSLISLPFRLQCNSSQTCQHHTVCNCQLLFVPVNSLTTQSPHQPSFSNQLHATSLSCKKLIFVNAPTAFGLFTSFLCKTLFFGQITVMVYFCTTAQQNRLKQKISIDCWPLNVKRSRSSNRKKVGRYLLSRFYGASFVGQLHWQHFFELCRPLCLYDYLLMCSCTLLRESVEEIGTARRVHTQMC